MAKNYSDLSRRGLIQLGKDFDSDNEGALLQYLTENGEKYEDIRPVESVIERIDQVSETIGNSGRKIKAVLFKEGDNMLDSVVDAISGLCDIVGPKIEDMASF